jgi:hypothetical protein
LPNLGFGIDNREAKQVVQLFQRNDLYFVRFELDVPLVVVRDWGWVAHRPIVPANGFGPHVTNLAAGRLFREPLLPHPLGFGAGVNI